MAAWAWGCLWVGATVNRMIRHFAADDAAQVLALNAACQPEVGPMDDTKLASFVEWAPYFRVVEVADRIVGLLIGLDHTAPYGSPNYGWFVDHLDRFAYIDRVAIAAQQRGQGWGPALYHDFERWAAGAGLPRLCAEVNIVPPNPRSVRFHELFGFEALEEFQPTGSADYRVVMMSKPTNTGQKH